MQKYSWKIVLADITLFVLAVLTLVGLYNLSQPQFLKGTWHMQDQKIEQVFTPPLRFDSDRTIANVNMLFRLPRLHPNHFLFVPDDCIQEITINGKRVEDDTLPFCDYSRGRTLDLTSYLHPGDNLFSITLKNKGGAGGLSIKPRFNTVLLIALLALFMFTCAGCAFYLVHIFSLKRIGKWLLFILLLGVTVRLLYFMATPFTTRAHDVTGHIDFIRYIVDHFRLPQATDGWEFYQPPLYYILSALLVTAGEFFGRTAEATNYDLQTWAFLLSAITFIVGVWTAHTLFQKKKEQWLVILFSSILAVFPGLVFFSSRINNDVLFQLIAFLFFVFLLRWWQKNKSLDWYIACIMIGLGILVKSNAILFLPIAFTCLLFNRSITLKKKGEMLFFSTASIWLIASWYIIPRMLQEKDFLVGNIGNLHSSLKLYNGPSAFLTFHPFHILESPYNNPWRDISGRNFFWDYFFRSAFFGEFKFDKNLLLTVRSLLALALLSLPLMLVGLVSDLRNRLYKTLPIFMTTVILLLGHAAFRFRYNYSSSQDFRYSILLIIPLTYYAIRGCSVLPQWMRRLTFTLISLFVLLCLGFLFSLSNF